MVDIRKLTDAMLKCDTAACADALGFNRVDGTIRDCTQAVDNVLAMPAPDHAEPATLEDARDLAAGWERLYLQVKTQRDILLKALRDDMDSSRDRYIQALDAVANVRPEGEKD